MTQREIRRQQILDRARDVFAKKGYHLAKIDDVVAAAGVARGTFYLYFHDKRSIFEELVSRFFQRVALAVASIDTDQPIEPQIRANFSRLLDVFLGDPGMAKILLTDVTGLDVEFDRRLLAFYADIEALLLRSLREGQSLGIVQDGDARVVAHFVLGGVKEVLLQLTRAPVPVDREAISENVFGILARAVLVPRPPKATKKAAKKRA
ncbi:MAG: TetR/AcrR family transcriptional regulator [Myxococcales bacterium]|nr:TetR/AcrR family transcriptional regulator [Myxococcales bacterium]